MDLGISGKVAFIAASSDGLGRACAVELATEGCNVIICGRDADRLAKAKSEVAKAGDGKILAIKADLTNQQDLERLVSNSIAEFGGVDILVTNSGGPPPGKFEDLSKSDWDNAYNQLLVSTTTLIKGFLPHMKIQNWGRILAITSQAVKQPVDNLILSNSIRSSVVGLIKTLASELGPYNITCNNIMPGYTQTSRLQNLIESNPSFANATSEIPLGRFGNPDEFAAAVTFLASKRASYITGISIAVDGGWIKNLL